jgi:hypothetical protein
MADGWTTEWRRDGSGGRWRVWKGRMAFLFLAGDGRWHWSIADSRHVRLSEENFATEGEARAALGEALGEGPGAWEGWDSDFALR